MPSLRLVWLVGVSVGLSLSACGGGGAAGPQGPMAGHWLGTATGLTMEWNLKDNSGQLSGTGNFSVSTAALSVNISGSRADTTVNLTLTASGYQPATFTGLILSDTLVSGSLNGSGFGLFFINMHKH